MRSYFPHRIRPLFVNLGSDNFKRRFHLAFLFIPLSSLSFRRANLFSSCLPYFSPSSVAEENSDRKKKLKEDQEQLEKKLDAITQVADVYARAKPVDKVSH